MWFSPRKLEIPSAEEALPGRDTALRVSEKHFSNGNPMKPPFPDGMEQIVFALGCFWGAERIFWQMPGVYTTAVGYIAGHTNNLTYDEVCSGRTGHTDGAQVFWEHLHPRELAVNLQASLEAQHRNARLGGDARFHFLGDRLPRFAFPLHLADEGGDQLQQINAQLLRHTPVKRHIFFQPLLRLFVRHI